MTRLITFIALITFSFSLLAQIEDGLQFGTDSTLDIVSWNIEWFPKDGNTTVEYVADIIEALDCEIYAIQEIDDTVKFNQLLASLDNYEGTYESSYFAGLGYIYKKDEVEMNDIYEIYTTSQYWSAFPRSPMVANFDFKNENFIVMNNHFKCCGDGNFDFNNSNDEETRRYYAVYYLKEYIDNFLPTSNVIVLGDMNDILTDDEDDNVFLNILEDTENYYFADWDIAIGTNNDWSYPSWPSHLDHIFITNDLMDELNKNGSTCQTIRVDDHITGGWWSYDDHVSDHRPVGIKLVIGNHAVNNSPIYGNSTFGCFPNPVIDNTEFVFNANNKNGTIHIYTIEGKEIKSLNILGNSTTYAWNVQNLESGIYIVKFISENEQVSTLKVIKQ